MDVNFNLTGLWKHTAGWWYTAKAQVPMSSPVRLLQVGVLLVWQPTRWTLDFTISAWHIANHRFYCNYFYSAPLVWHSRSNLHIAVSAPEKGLAAPIIILRKKGKKLWLVWISLNQSQSSWAAWSPVCCNCASAKRKWKGSEIQTEIVIRWQVLPRIHQTRCFFNTVSL